MNHTKTICTPLYLVTERGSIRGKSREVEFSTLGSDLAPRFLDEYWPAQHSQDIRQSLKVYERKKMKDIPKVAVARSTT